MSSLKDSTRRQFIQTGTSAISAMYPGFWKLVSGFEKPDAENQDRWKHQVPEILKRIIPPTFQDVNYVITDFGAIGDGQSDCHAALSKAIDTCNSAGGGKVIVPEGIWRVNGPIRLKSHVHLHLREGATIRFNPDPDLYLPMVLTRWEGTELYNYSPMIYSYQATHVAITGKGTIDGMARESFATWKPRQKEAQSNLRKMGAEGVPVHQRLFGKGHWLRPPMIQFFGCRNVLVEGISIVDAPFWVIHPVYCQNVIVRGIQVQSHNANNDGVDPDSSVDVLIEDCRFDTGDDSVAIKSGRDEDAWRIGNATENVVVRNCEMNSRANGLCIGSEMSGNVRNIFMEDCRIGKVDSAIYFKGNRDRGGIVENVSVRNIKVEKADWLIHFTTDYHSYRGGEHAPLFRNFDIERVTCEASKTAIQAVGVPGFPIRNVSLKDITVKQAEIVSNINHTENFVLKNVQVNGLPVSW